MSAWSHKVQLLLCEPGERAKQEMTLKFHSSWVRENFLETISLTLQLPPDGFGLKDVGGNAVAIDADSIRSHATLHVVALPDTLDVISRLRQMELRVAQLEHRATEHAERKALRRLRAKVFVFSFFLHSVSSVVLRSHFRVPPRNRPNLTASTPCSTLLRRRRCRESRRSRSFPLL